MEPVGTGDGWSEASYRAWFEASPDGVLVTDSAGAYSAVNEAACVLLGRSPDEIVGRSVFELIDEPQRPQMEERVSELRSTGSVRFEWALRRPDCTEVRLDVVTTILPGGGRQSIVRDVTDQVGERDALAEVVRIAELFTSGATRDAVLGAILDAALSVARADLGHLQLYDAATDRRCAWRPASTSTTSPAPRLPVSISPPWAACGRPWRSASPGCVPPGAAFGSIRGCPRRGGPWRSGCGSGVAGWW